MRLRLVLTTIGASAIGETDRGQPVAVIGRESELEVVESFLDDAGPAARALLLHGEAGIGKTTLWHAAVDGARSRGYRILTTRPTAAEARLPFAGLNDLFAELAELGDGRLPAPQQAALDVALMRARVDGGPMQPLALSLAVLELVRLSAAERPLAIAIDDVQWLDESSAGIVRFALRRLEAEPVVVIATERTGTCTEGSSVIADLPLNRVTRVEVGSLSVDAMDHLLDDSLSLRLPPTMLRHVHHMSAGNPLYSVEIGRALKTRGVSRSTGLVPLPLPESLTGLLRARLEALPPEASEVATHAAALAQPTVAHLEAVLGVDRARAGIARARDAGVLAAGDGPIHFSHPLLAAEAYAGVGEEDRRELHRRLAAVVTEPEELARHLALAASGPDPEVAATLDAAAAHAHGRGAPDAAADLMELAARLTADRDARRAHRLAAAGRYRLMAGDVGRARALLERALDDPVAARGPARAVLLYRLAGVRQLMDDFTASEALAEEALRHAGSDMALTVEIKLLLAGVAYITGRGWSAGAAHAIEAMALAEQLDDPRALAATIGAYASWRHATGHGFDPDLARRADEVAPWTVSLRTLDLPQFDMANIELAEGMTASAFARLHELLERAESDGDYSSLPFLLCNLTLGDFLDGRADAARARIERARRLADTTDQRTAQVHALVAEARLESRLGDAGAAWSAARAAFELMESTGWRVGEWWMRTDLALLELSRGDPAAALQNVRGARVRTGGEESGRHRWAQPVAADALVALGRHEEARAILDALDAHLADNGPRRLRAEALRSRARLLGATGDLAAAGEAVATAESMHREMGDRWELARTLLVAAEIHRRARRRARARDALAEALESFELLEARRWAEHAREQLARIGAGRQEGGLTPTEQEVAELVARGLTNRQVADRLFMSAHTVEAHLTAIYRSLGIRSRMELDGALSAVRQTLRDSRGLVAVEN